MQISSIRLTDTRHRKAHARSGRSPSQVLESIASQARIQTLALSKRTAAPLASIPQEAAEPPLHVVVRRAEDATRVAVLKVLPPAAQQPIDGCHGLRQR